MNHKLDDHATLTTDHPASSYGVPVLLEEGFDQPLGPTDSFPSNLTAEDFVQAYYRIGDPLPPLVRTFLEAHPAPNLHTIGLLAGTEATGPPFHSYKDRFAFYSSRR